MRTLDQGRPLSAAGRATVRVASVPSDHVYVRHLSPVDGDDGVVRLDDPHPDIPGQSALERWWPPAMLRPDWVETNHATFDLMHVHFGFDACAPEQLEELVATLRRQGKPLVYTAHDLRNPHHLDRTLHDQHLDVVVPAADAVVTLTDGAATEIRERWGREAIVLPHPHVVDLETMAAIRRPERTGFRVGVHVKSLRASMDPLPVLRVLRDVLADDPDAVLQVNGHRDVLEETGERYEPELARTLREWAAAGEIDLRVHDFLSDAELWDYFSALDVSVLPYRFGTHSGWLEACRDLGTTVVAPDCGYFADQGPVHSYHHDEHGLDEASLADAVRRARTPAARITVEERRRQRDRVAREHELIYRAVL